MIISTKYLITGDGKTVLTDKAVYIGEDGKIGKIAPKEEAAERISAGGS